MPPTYGILDVLPRKTKRRTRAHLREVRPPRHHAAGLRAPAGEPPGHGDRWHDVASPRRPDLAARDRPLQLRPRQDRGDARRVQDRGHGDPGPARGPRALPGSDLRHLRRGGPRHRGDAVPQPRHRGRIALRAHGLLGRRVRAARPGHRGGARGRGHHAHHPLRGARREKRRPHARRRAQAPLPRGLRVRAQRGHGLLRPQRGGRLLAGLLARRRGRAPQEGHARHRRGAHPAELDGVCELAESLDFGDDLRGTAAWRRAVAPALVRRAVERAAGKPRAEKEA